MLGPLTLCFTSSMCELGASYHSPAVTGTSTLPPTPVLPDGPLLSPPEAPVPLVVASPLLVAGPVPGAPPVDPPAPAGPVGPPAPAPLPLPLPEVTAGPPDEAAPLASPISPVHAARTVVARAPRTRASSRRFIEASGDGS